MVKNRVIVEADEKREEKAKAEMLEKLTLIEGLKPGQGIVIGATYEGKEGVYELEKYLSLLKDQHAVIMDSPKSNALEIKYKGKRRIC